MKNYFYSHYYLHLLFWFKVLFIGHLSCYTTLGSIR
nr:MAG TPA: hypothetical protein [Caudoviricetes sp.]